MGAIPRSNRIKGLSVGKSNLHVYTIDGSKTDWMAQGKCAQPDVDPESYFLFAGKPEGDRDDVPSTETNRSVAARLCRGCPVIRECYTHAIDKPEGYGVWGGATPTDRDHAGTRSALYIPKDER